MSLREMAKFVRRDYVDLRFRNLAEKILSEAGVDGHNTRGEVAALLTWTQKNLTYRKDPYGIEYIRDAERGLRSGQLDCDDLCVVLATLLASVGIPSRFCVSSSDGQDFDHVFLEVFIDGKYEPVDPTNPKANIGWRVQSRFNDLVFPIFEGDNNMMGDWYTPPVEGGTDWGQLLNQEIISLPGQIYAARGVPYYGGGGVIVSGGPNYNPGAIGGSATGSFSNQGISGLLNLTPTTWLIIFGVLYFLTRKK